jgi:hypothetical protein
MFIQAFIALATEVMPDVLVKFLAQQSVFVTQLRILFTQAGVVGFQCRDTGTQLLDFLEQCGVGHVPLTGRQTDCSNS